jgi:hypothetical protein
MSMTTVQEKILKIGPAFDAYFVKLVLRFSLSHAYDQHTPICVLRTQGLIMLIFIMLIYFSASVQ